MRLFGSGSSVPRLKEKRDVKGLVKSLLRSFDEGDPEMARDAADAICALRDESAIPLLAAIVDDPARLAFERPFAVEAMSCKGNRLGADYLTRRAQQLNWTRGKDDQELLKSIVLALASIGQCGDATLELIRGVMKSSRSATLTDGAVSALLACVSDMSGALGVLLECYPYVAEDYMRAPLRDGLAKALAGTDAPLSDQIFWSLMRAVCVESGLGSWQVAALQHCVEKPMAQGLLSMYEGHRALVHSGVMDGLKLCRSDPLYEKETVRLWVNALAENYVEDLKRLDLPTARSSTRDSTVTPQLPPGRSEMTVLACPSCGKTLDHVAVKGTSVRCDACGGTFRVE